MSGTISTPIHTPFTLTVDPTTITATGAITLPLEDFNTALYGPGVTPWTVYNYGSVEGPFTVGAGMVFDSASTLMNAGLVVGGFRNSTIVMFAGGTVTNLSGGVIGGGSSGIEAEGLATIINGGSITGYSALGSGAGLLLMAGGSVTNYAGGTIAGSTGIDLGADGILQNDGWIGAQPVDAGSQIDGVLFHGSGTVYNGSSGVITGRDAAISGYSDLTVENEGTILGGEIGSAISAGGQSTIYNDSFALISGGYGIRFAGTIVNAGTILGDSHASDDMGPVVNVLSGGGVLTNMAGALISAGEGGVFGLSGAVTLTNAGTIAAAAGFDAVSLSGAFSNAVTVAPGAVFIGSVEVSDVDADTPVSLAPPVSTLVLADGTTIGTITGVGSQFLNFGSIGIEGGARWFLSGNSAGLQNGQTISGFAPGDTIEITGAVEHLVSYDGGTLVLNGTVDPDILLPGAFLPSDFVVTDDGTNTSITVTCFVKGTRIATPVGATNVEDLQAGDTVLTHEGTPKRIVWVGYRHVDCTRHRRPELAWPVLVCAGAFGPGRPARDLLLSPDHCIYASHVLIPVKHLLDGTTIKQVPVEQVTYYHLELPRHDVVLAEGLPVESYLDTDGRTNFANGGGVMRLFPDFAALADDTAFLWEAIGYAPRMVIGAQVEATRALLANRAKRKAKAASRKSRPDRLGARGKTG
jgi:Hint domain